MFIASKSITDAARACTVNLLMLTTPYDLQVESWPSTVEITMIPIPAGSSECTRAVSTF